MKEVLNEFGALIWIEPPNVFISNNIDRYLNKSKETGILTWPRSEPVTQMSHPLMFKYFGKKASDFHFIHMIDTTQFILYNNKNIHARLMLPWVSFFIFRMFVKMSRIENFIIQACIRSNEKLLTNVSSNFFCKKYPISK